MDEEGMPDSQIVVKDLEVNYEEENDILQNNNGCGSWALASQQFVDANDTILDTSSKEVLMSIDRASDLLLGFSIYTEPIRTGIIEHAFCGMDELSKIGIAGHPLWQRETNNGCEILNNIEYLRQFGEVDTTLREIVKLMEVGESQNLPSFDTHQTELPTSTVTPTVTPHTQTEGSRDIAYINMAPICIVELLMDVMSTELHLPAPVLLTRECYFGRYSKQLSYSTWGVVDVSLEKFLPSPTTNFLKRPSGCLITGMPNGYSKVIWVEHVEAEDSHVDQYFRSLFTSTVAFGATRWTNSLVRYGEWLQSLFATSLVADEGVLIAQTGRTSLLKLADRMMKTFCRNMSSTADNPWTQMAYSPYVRIMVKNNMDEPGKPPGTSVVFTTSVWLDVSPNRLFNFLRHENSRTKWDSLSRRHTIREFASMLKGQNPGNRVSLMRANNSEGKLVICFVQESYTDSTGSYVVYAPLDKAAVAGLIHGSNPDKVMILPSGFSILPERLEGDEDRSTRSLLTIAFHIVESCTTRPYIAPESVETIYKVISDTVTSITDSVLYHNHRNNCMDDSNF
ncbi:homeobox-leucine zipper protein PROTODERMAL FACTOR 2-like [Phaseolus vulgaris]